MIWTCIKSKTYKSIELTYKLTISFVTKKSKLYHVKFITFFRFESWADLLRLDINITSDSKFGIELKVLFVDITI